MGKQLRPGLRRSLRFQMASGVRHVPRLFLKFGENHGDVAYDSSPYGNDGDIEGPSWTKGILGPGLSFDGTDDYVDCGDIDALEGINSLTIVAWVKVVTFQADRGVVAKRASGQDSWQLTTSITYGNHFWCTVWTSVGIYGVATTRNKVSGVWYHVAFVYDGSTIRTYVNGKLDCTPVSATGTITQTSSHVQLGSFYGAYFLNGILDEVRVYSRALTAREVLELYYGIE